MKKKLLITLIISTIAILAFGAISASATISSDYTYTISNGEATITGIRTATSEDIVIPSKLGGYPVTTIGSYAFYNHTDLTSVTIPYSVTTIRNSAFRYCTGLTSISIPNNVTVIGDDAFYSCDSLTSITIPYSVTTIGEGVFESCDALTYIDVNKHNQFFCSVDGNLFNKSKTTLIQYAIGKNATSYKIPNGVTTIGDNAFSGCTGLTSVTIPNSVTSIGKSAFAWCDALTSITIPDGVATIGEYTFSQCDSLTCITIPDSVTTIDKSAFYYCTGLTSVAIPDSVTSIGECAFSGCSNISDVYYNGTKEECYKISIGNYNEPLKNANIHYLAPYTITTVSADGKSFLIKPVNIENGKVIILALYDGNTFVEMQKATYTGSDIPFTTTKNYTKAVVMVWNSLSELSPYCSPEIVK